VANAVFRTHPDSIHMNTELASRVIDGLGTGACSHPDGVALSGKSIDGYLGEIEARRERFVRDHPAFAADVAAFARTLPHRPEVLNAIRP
jgi:hypothetical protein